MKKTLYPADKRGSADYGWLKTHYSFSFANYYDPEKIHFGMLRVLNDDIIGPGMGFGTHPHDNMEIITIPLQGALEHRDSMGNHGVIRHGEVQVMSAGSGITHSEFNHSKTEETKLLQLWIFPSKKNVEPRYQQKKFLVEEIKDKFMVLVEPEQKDETVWIYQNAWLSIGNFSNEKDIIYRIRGKNNGAYLFILEGAAEIEGENLGKRDAIGIWETEEISLKSKEDLRILVIEVPMN